MDQSLQTAELELKLQVSQHAVEMISKDEERRRAAVAQLLLQDELDELRDQLQEEEARANDVESALDDALVQNDQHQVENESLQDQTRTQTRELGNLRVRRPIDHGALCC